jgi:antitoxin component YwqK of YwqJK toxin-antitoxin module
MGKTDAVPEEKTLLFPDEKIKERKFILEGKREGEYTSYYHSGQVLAHINFIRGKKNGAALIY